MRCDNRHSHPDRFCASCRSGRCRVRDKPDATEGQYHRLHHFEFSIGGKWLQLLKVYAPSIDRVAVAFDPCQSHMGCVSAHDRGGRTIVRPAANPCRLARGRRHQATSCCACSRSEWRCCRSAKFRYGQTSRIDHRCSGGPTPARNISRSLPSKCRRRCLRMLIR